MKNFTSKTFTFIADAMKESNPEEAIRNLDGDPIKNLNNLMEIREWINKATKEAAKVSEEKGNFVPVYLGVTEI